MGKVLDFDKGKNTGYKYFAKAVLDHLCEGEPNEQDIRIDVMDAKGKIREIVSAQLDRDTATVTIMID